MPLSESISIGEILSFLFSGIRQLFNALYSTGFQLLDNSASIQIGNTSPLVLSRNEVVVSAPQSSLTIHSHSRSESLTALTAYTSTRTLPSTFTDTIQVGNGESTTYQLVPITLNGNIQAYAYVLDSQIQQTNSYYTSSTPVLTLLNYTYDFQKQDGTSLYVGNIHFQEVTITSDPFKNRLWHFRWGGEIVANKFSTVFTFDPNTTLPIGDENVLITQINFDSAFYPGQQEYIQGHITVNNHGIDISYLRRVLDFTWDAENATMTLKFNLTNWSPQWSTLLNWVQVPPGFNPSTYKDTGPTPLLSANGSNSVHVELAIRDAVTTKSFLLYGITPHGWTSGTSYTVYVYSDNSYSAQIGNYTWTASTSSNMTVSYSSAYTKLYLKVGTYTTSFTPISNGTYYLYYSNSNSSIGFADITCALCSYT